MCLWTCGQRCEVSEKMRRREQHLSSESECYMSGQERFSASLFCDRLLAVVSGSFFFFTLSLRHVYLY